MILTNICVQIFALLITILLLLCNQLDRAIRETASTLMNAMLIVNAILLISEIASWSAVGFPALGLINSIITFGDNSLGYVLAVIYTLYVAYTIADESLNMPSWMLGWIFGLCILGILLNFISIFNHMFFYYDGGSFVMGPLYHGNTILSALILAPLIIFILVHNSIIGLRSSMALIINSMLPMCAILLQVIIPQLDLMCLATTLSLLIIYVTVYVRRGNRLAQKELELSESRVSIMLGQIQPHFLYNTLSVIQDMCHGQAPEAEEATIEFSEFLRGNIDSLKAQKPIPFSLEMAHTRNYLALESRRFGDLLHVVWDVRATDFLIPPLTLQPIVENAVRYGAMAREDGGTVEIRGWQDAKHYTVTIIDDGPGFDIKTKKADGRTHIGISNVAERLRTMCGGSLVINSVPDQGTTAAITIPKGASFHDNSR